MRCYRLFHPSLAKGRIVLSTEESQHATASLRLKQGREVLLFDGAGQEAIGVITRVDRRQLCVDVQRITRRPFELSCKITLAVAMSKTHRQGYLIEKCTELGVAAIWPVIAERSTSRPDKTAVAKWSRRAIEAAKQSKRSWVPKIEPPVAFLKCLERLAEFDASSLTHTDPSATPFVTFLEAHREKSTLLLWVGPEGGWSDAECERAIQAGAVATSLGPTILRTETAAVAVCAATAIICGAGSSPSVRV